MRPSRSPAGHAEGFFPISNLVLAADIPPLADALIWTGDLHSLRQRWSDGFRAGNPESR
jgi:hypothetical protein